jgi:type I restriction enzyme S subunit
MKRVRLGDCARIVSGATPRTSDLTHYGGDIPWVTPKDLSNLDVPELWDTSRKITESGYRNCSTELLPVGSILFSSRAPIGLVAIAQREVCTNQGFKSIVPNSTLDSRYLYWQIKDLAPSIAARGNGSTFKEVSKPTMEDVMISVPPLEEQKRIAAILDKADAIRRKREQAIQLADEFLRSLFLDMFGDPVRNPKGWPVTSLGELCTRITDGTHQPPKLVKEGIPFLFVSNVVNGSLLFDKTKFISEETWRLLTSRCPIEKGDVLYTTVGSYGNAAPVLTDRKFAFQRHIAHIKPDPHRVNSSFLAFMLNSAGVRRQADQLCRGIAQQTVNLRELRQFKVFLLPKDDQLQFLKTAESVFDLKARAIASRTFTAGIQRSLGKLLPPSPQ